MIKLIMLFVLWVAGAAVLCFGLCPEMLLSGNPDFILLAFLLPPTWLVVGLLAWIALADNAWSRAPAPVDPDLDTSAMWLEAGLEQISRRASA